MLRLDQLVLNEANPRSISDKKFHQLIDSLLIFPRMLELRPIVARADGTILGGNMRYKALIEIGGLTIYQVEARLKENRKFQELSTEDQQSIIDYWDNFLSTRQVPVTIAEHLTDAQVQEFIIKDNVGFGSWDIDMLGELWDKSDLEDWGLDIVWPDSGTDESTQESAPKSISHKLIVECGELNELEKLFHELEGRGFDVKLKEGD